MTFDPEQETALSQARHPAPGPLYPLALWGIQIQRAAPRVVSPQSHRAAENRAVILMTWLAMFELR